MENQLHPKPGNLVVKGPNHQTGFGYNIVLFFVVMEHHEKKINSLHFPTEEKHEPYIPMEEYVVTTTLQVEPVVKKAVGALVQLRSTLEAFGNCITVVRLGMYAGSLFQYTMPATGSDRIP